MKILLIVYDNGSHIPFFPQGIAYIAASLQKEGHHVELFQQDITHQSIRHLTTHIDSYGFDVVGLGFVAGYYQFKVCSEVALAVNAAKSRGNFRFVLGGHGPAAAPEYFLDKFNADRACVGEGENWMCATPENPEPFNMKDVDSIPWPAYEMFHVELYRLIRWPTSNETDFCMPVLSGRGCPYHCNFCYRMNEGDFRPRDPEAVIEEMYWLWQHYHINHFQFSDELFMSSKRRVMDFCVELICSGKIRKIKNFKWDCNGRLNFAKPDILLQMKDAGCEYVNYGIEALDNKVLATMHKGLTVDTITEGVEATLRAGLIPGLNFIWGNIGDTKETLDQAVNFLVRYDPCKELRTIRPVTPYPGSELFDIAVESGLLEGPADFYENKHVNSDLLTVNFTDLSCDEFHQALNCANYELINNYYEQNRENTVINASGFYQGVIPPDSFRGFRAV